MPKVSINIPCFNSEKYIAETLQSVLSQTFEDFEIILVNDGSTDKTEEIIKTFSDPRIKYYYQKNMGLGNTRNRQLALSSGDFIAFLDHDDIWLPTKLEKQIPLFENQPKVGLVYCDTIFFNDKGDVNRLYNNRVPLRGNVFRQILKDYFLAMPSVVIRKKALDSQQQLFDDNFSMSEERDLFTRIAYDWDFDYVGEPLAKWRMHSKSLTFSKRELVSRETELTIAKFIEIYPNFESEYKSELVAMKVLNQYHYALLDWEKGHSQNARSRLKPFIWRDIRYLAVFFLSFLPFAVYTKLKWLRGTRPS